MKPFIRIAGAALGAAVFTTSAVAGSTHAYYIEAPVVDVKPLIEIVQVKTPQEVCWNERVEHRVHDRRRGPATATIVGTILGGAIGHNIARGDDRRTARIAGAVLGGAIGRDTADRNARSRTVVSSERVCEVEHVTHEEERISGYRVTYLYDGRELMTRTSADPGETLRLRVSVSPID